MTVVVVGRISNDHNITTIILRGSNFKVRRY